MKRNVLELSLTCVCLLLFTLSNFAKYPLVYTVLSFYVIFLISIAAMYKLNPTEAKLYIQNNNERSRVRFVLVLVLNVCLLLVALEPWVLNKYKLYTHPFYEFNNNLGYVACGVFLFSLLLLPTFKVLKINSKVDSYIKHLKNKEILHNEYELKVFNLTKKCTSWVAKQLRRHHIAFSLLGITIVFYHVYLSLINGFKASYTYISGYAGLFDLLLLSVLGLLRLKRVDRNLHKRLSYLLILFAVLHIVFSELRM
jgi:hypothetical protein